MTQIDIVRAWKDSKYRASLTEAERSSLPPNPVGELTLTEAELEHVVGGVLVSTAAGGSCRNPGNCGSNDDW